MDFFPKKYTQKDLRKRSIQNKELYTTENNKKDILFTPNILPGSKKLSYQDFFLIYLRDFYVFKILDTLQNVLYLQV